MAAAGNVRWFSDIRLHDVASVGGKNASLGELYSTLSGRGVRVPNGFALTAQSYRDALSAAGAWDRLHELLDGVDKTRIDVLAKRAGEARDIVFDATGTDRLRQEIAAAYRQLEANMGPTSPLRCAVRPRPRICRPRASPASTRASSTSAARGMCSRPAGAASPRIFTDRAIVYRIDNGFDHFKVALVGRRDEDGALRPGRRAA